MVVEFAVNAWTELKTRDGHGLKPVLSGVLIAVCEYLWGVYNCIMEADPQCQKKKLPFSIVTVATIILYVVLQGAFTPLILLLSKLIKFGLRTVQPLDMISNQIQAQEGIFQGVIASAFAYCVSATWKMVKEMGGCIRRNNCDEESWFNLPIKIADENCGDWQLCRSFAYQFNHFVVTVAVCVFNYWLYCLWTGADGVPLVRVNDVGPDDPPVDQNIGLDVPPVVNPIIPDPPNPPCDDNNNPNDQAPVVNPDPVDVNLGNPPIPPFEAGRVQQGIVDEFDHRIRLMIQGILGVVCEGCRRHVRDHLGDLADPPGQAGNNGSGQGGSSGRGGGSTSNPRGSRGRPGGSRRGVNSSRGDPPTTRSRSRQSESQSRRE